MANDAQSSRTPQARWEGLRSQRQRRAVLENASPLVTRRIVDLVHRHQNRAIIVPTAENAKGHRWSRGVTQLLPDTLSCWSGALT
jgi:hypothetical protein